MATKDAQPVKFSHWIVFSLAIGTLYLNAYKTAEAEDIPSWLTERRIIGANNLEQVRSGPLNSSNFEAYDLAKVVARVETPDGSGFCTGSRVGENLFLTNFHCFDFVPCERVFFHLGYEKDLPKSRQLVYQCKEVIAYEETFDYALYTVEFVGTQDAVDKSRGIGLPLDSTLLVAESSIEPAKPSDYPIAKLWTGDLSTSMNVVVPSHPSARLKEIDRSAECKIVSTEIEELSSRQTITHSCDTEGGSSGSPLIDKNTGNIVALHWGGQSGINMAIPMYLVVKDIESKLSRDTYAKLTIAK